MILKLRRTRERERESRFDEADTNIYFSSVELILQQKSFWRKNFLFAIRKLLREVFLENLIFRES